MSDGIISDSKSPGVIAGDADFIHKKETTKHSAETKKLSDDLLA